MSEDSTEFRRILLAACCAEKPCDRIDSSKLLVMMSMHTPEFFKEFQTLCFSAECGLLAGISTHHALVDSDFFATL